MVRNVKNKIVAVALPVFVPEQYRWFLNKENNSVRLSLLTTPSDTCCCTPFRLYLECPLGSIIICNVTYSRTDNNWCLAGTKQDSEVTLGLCPVEIAAGWCQLLSELACPSFPHLTTLEGTQKWNSKKHGHLPPAKRRATDPECTLTPSLPFLWGRR